MVKNLKLLCALSLSLIASQHRGLGVSVKAVDIEPSNTIETDDRLVQNKSKVSLVDESNAKKGDFFYTDKKLSIGDRTVDSVGYIATFDDNYYLITGKVCKYYDIPFSTEFWPVIPYLNRKKDTVVSGGNVFYIPRYLEDFNYAAEYSTEWRKNFTRRNASHKSQSKKNSYELNTLGGLITDIYGEGGYLEELTDKSYNVDDEFIDKLLSVHGIESINPNTPLSEVPNDDLHKIGDTFIIFNNSETKKR